MKTSQRFALIARVTHKLREAGSWAGRTHIQKYLYFAQGFLQVPSDYEFVLYQRGPYSFDLDADIRALRSIGGIDLEPVPPYGPQYSTTRLGDSITKLYPVDDRLDDALTALARALGPKNALHLELLATAHYVLSEGQRTDEEMIQRLVSLKPHFSPDEARTALREVVELEKQHRLQ